MKKMSLRYPEFGLLTAFSLMLFIFIGVAIVPNQASAQPEPFVAIHVSELTQALETMHATLPTPTGLGTTGYEWFYTSWHYFVAYESLKEALRSDGTPFVIITDSDIAAGLLRNIDGSPRYPILISLASEAIAGNEISPLRDYVSAGGFLFAGSSSFTRNPNGTTRGDFALASEMGLHMANSSLSNWYENQHFAKTVAHRLTSHIPNGTLAWYSPLTAEEIPWGISPSHIQHTNHYAWQVVVGDATIIANGDSGPLLSAKNYGQGQFIYHGKFQPLIGHGGYDPGMYEYLIYRRAIEWAFESFKLPIVKVSPWPYQYDAAFVVRHDFENNQSSIRSIESSAQFEHSLGAKGDYYFSTGALREDMGGDQVTVASLRSAVSNFGATIGSHNGGLKNPVNISLLQTDYDYWHWGPDEALDTTPKGYTNGKAYASASILASFQDIAGWLTGLDNGRPGCGAARNCPRTWVSPYFNSTREGSYDVLEQLGSITMGEQKISPFPHWTMSYQTLGKHYSHITLPVSDWYIGSSIAQCLTYADGRDVFTANDIREAVDFYYNLGALINFYGHMPSNYGTVGSEYISYSMSKPRIWPTNIVGVNDWWRLRSNVVTTPTINTTGATYTVTTSISGATDPETAIDLALPQIQGQPISNVNVFLNGTLASPSDYRTINSGIKVRVGSSVSNVEVQYTLNSSPVAMNDTFSTTQNTTLYATPGVLNNDTDPGGALLTAQWVSGPSNGTLTLNTNGSFSYTPATNFVGTDSFTYAANNGSTNSNIAIVSITVGYAGTVITPHEVTTASAGGVCNAPANIVAGNLLIASFLQGSKSGNPALPSGWVLDSTQDFNSYAYRLCVAHKIAGGAESGTYIFSGYGGSGIYDLSIVRLDGNDTSNPVDSGARASSSVVSSSATYTFPTVTTTYANDLLYYVGEAIGTPSCTWPGGTLELYDPVDGHSAGYEIQSILGGSTAKKITWSASSSERMGMVVAYKSATFTANNPVPTTTSLSPTSATAGGATFTLTVNGSNFINGSVVQWKGVSRTTTYVSSTQLTAAITAADIASGGTASVTVFNPAPGGGTSNAQTFTINAVKPVAVNDTYSTTANTTLNQAAPGVLNNDTDSAGAALTAQLTGGPSHGTLSLNSNGSFTYTPAPNYAGSDSFTYVANNGTTTSNVATVTIAVTSTGGVLFSDDFTRGSNPPDPLFPWVNGLGTWTVANGVLQGSSSPSTYASIYTSTMSLWTDYTVEGQIQFPAGAFGGGIGGRVNPVNGARYGAWIYPDGSSGGSNVLKLVKFRDWTTWNYTPMQQVSLPSVGTGWHGLKIAFNGSRIQVYYDGALMIDVTDNNFDSRAPYLSGWISGDMWTSASSYVMGLDNVVVRTVSSNLPPVAVNDAYSTNANTVLNQAAPGVLTNDSDPEGTVLTAQLVSSPSHGTITLNSNGSFAYTPSPAYVGNDSFAYKANNGTIDSNVAIVTITVTSTGSVLFSDDFTRGSNPPDPLFPWVEIIQHLHHKTFSEPSVSFAMSHL